MSEGIGRVRIPSIFTQQTDPTASQKKTDSAPKTRRAVQLSSKKQAKITNIFKKETTQPKTSVQNRLRRRFSWKKGASLGRIGKILAKFGLFRMKKSSSQSTPVQQKDSSNQLTKDPATAAHQKSVQQELAKEIAQRSKQKSAHQPSQESDPDSTDAAKTPSQEGIPPPPPKEDPFCAQGLPPPPTEPHPDNAGAPKTPSPAAREAKGESLGGGTNKTASNDPLHQALLKEAKQLTAKYEKSRPVKFVSTWANFDMAKKDFGFLKMTVQAYAQKGAECLGEGGSPKNRELCDANLKTAKAIYKKYENTKITDRGKKKLGADPKGADPQKLMMLAKQLIDSQGEENLNVICGDMYKQNFKSDQDFMQGVVTSYTHWAGDQMIGKDLETEKILVGHEDLGKKYPADEKGFSTIKSLIEGFTNSFQKNKASLLKGCYKGGAIKGKETLLQHLKDLGKNRLNQMDLEGTPEEIGRQIVLADLDRMEADLNAFEQQLNGVDVPKDSHALNTSKLYLESNITRGKKEIAELREAVKKSAE